MKAFIVAALLGLAVAAPSGNSASDVRCAADANVAAPALIRRQEEEGEETFQAIVAECQSKLETGQITGTLDDCVLDALGIQRRQIGGTNISVSPEELERLTGECAAKTPGDQAKIYECVVKLIGLGRKASIAHRREVAEAAKAI